MRVNHAIVFVSDMSRSVSFFRDIVGLPLKFQSPEWTEFSTDGAILALHKSDESSSLASDPQPNGAGGCRPGLGVGDLDEFHRRTLENGVSCTQAPQDVYGAKMAPYRDSDGLVISVSEDRSGG